MTSASVEAEGVIPDDFWEVANDVKERAWRLHCESDVWNMCDSTGAEFADELYLEEIAASRATAINHTVVYSADFAQAVCDIMSWIRLYRRNPSYGFIATKLSDVAKARESGTSAIFMGFQDIIALDGDLDRLDAFYEMGIRFIQPTYQARNLAGDGCGERIQSGLSKFGLALIKRLNELGIVVDLSHVGKGSTLEAIEVSEVPVMVTHAGVEALADTPRNKSDDEIRALAARGGVMGIAAKSGFLKNGGLDKGSTVDDMVDHVAYIADLVGIEHACIGIDMSDSRKYTLERMQAFHARYPEVATIGDSMRMDLMHPEGMTRPRQLYNVTAALVRRGFSDSDVKLVLGDNVNRVLGEVLG